MEHDFVVVLAGLYDTLVFQKISAVDIQAPLEQVFIAFFSKDGEDAVAAQADFEDRLARVLKNASSGGGANALAGFQAAAMEAATSEAVRSGLRIRS